MLQIAKIFIQDFIRCYEVPHVLDFMAIYKIPKSISGRELLPKFKRLDIG